LYLFRRLNKRQNPELDLDIGQVLVIDAASVDRQRARQRALHGPSHDQVIALITRLGTASRSACFNADRLFTEEDLRRMEIESHPEEPDTTHNDLEQGVD
jgi:hypothetical protein